MNEINRAEQLQMNLNDYLLRVSFKQKISFKDII
jgi:hypothetical protein